MFLCGATLAGFADEHTVAFPVAFALASATPPRKAGIKKLLKCIVRRNRWWDSERLNEMKAFF